MKKSIDLQVFIKYNKEKALPGSLPLTDILRPRKVFWEDFTQIIKRGGTDFVQAEMYASAQSRNLKSGG